MGHDPASIRQLTVDEFRSRLAASMEMLCGESVVVEDSEDPSAPPLLWRVYVVDSTPACSIAVGAPELVGRAVGAKVLSAAGLEEITDEDVVGSYHEVLQGAVSAVFHTLGRAVGRELTFGSASDQRDEPKLALRVALAIRFPEQVLGPLVLGLSEEIAQLGATSRPRNQERVADASDPSASLEIKTVDDPDPEGHGLERILALDLPLRVSFGKASLPLQDVLKLTTGSIVELNRSILDPVEIIVNDRVVGRGEVVVVEGNYGIRIQEIVGLGSESSR